MVEPYTEEVSVTHNQPGCIIFLIDQSGSMKAEIRGMPGVRKCDFLADQINGILDDLLLRCTKNNKVVPYFHSQIISYGFQGDLVAPIVGSQQDPLILPLDRMAEWTDQNNGWADGRLQVIRPVAEGRTPMTQAFALLEEPVKEWVATNPNSYPPIILNITDGIPEPRTQENWQSLVDICTRLKRVTNANGSMVLIFSLHIGDSDTFPPAIFCNEQEAPQTPEAQLLFRCASHLPPSMAAEAQRVGLPVSPGLPKCYGYNIGGKELIKILQVGTRTGPMVAPPMA